VALLHEWGNIEREEHGPEGTLIEGRIPARLAETFRPYTV
jgi:hypothetical protein